jgi:hypothetical protein
MSQLYSFECAMFKVSGPDPVWVSSVMNRALPGEIFPGQAQPNIIEEEEEEEEEPVQPAQQHHIPVEEPSQPVNNSYLDVILETCPPGISDDSTLRNGIRNMFAEGITMCSQVSEQRLNYLAPVYQLDRFAYNKIIRLLNLDKKQEKNLKQKVSRRADEEIRIKGNKSSRDSQRRKREFLKAARAQQNI